MGMIKDNQGNERFSLPDNAIRILNRIKQKTHEEDDEAWGFLYGPKGSGKSVFAQHIGFVVDKTLCEEEKGIERICFTKQEFEKAVKTSRKQTVIGDEGISLFFSRGCMTREGRKIAVLSDQIRQKNLFILICIPKILNLDKFLLEEENLVFIGYVWKSTKIIGGEKVTTKGNVALYLNLKHDKRATAMIKFLQARKNNPGKFVKMPHPQIMVPGNAVTKKPWYPVGEAKYRRKKEAILDNEDNSTTSKHTKSLIADRVGKVNHDRIKQWFDKGLTNKEIVQLERCGKNTVVRARAKWKITPKNPTNMPHPLENQGFGAPTDL